MGAQRVVLLRLARRRGARVLRAQQRDGPVVGEEGHAAVHGPTSPRSRSSSPAARSCSRRAAASTCSTSSAAAGPRSSPARPTERRAHLMEIDPLYCDVIVNALAAAHGPGRDARWQRRDVRDGEGRAPGGVRDGGRPVTAPALAPRRRVALRRRAQHPQVSPVLRDLDPDQQFLVRHRRPRRPGCPGGAHGGLRGPRGLGTGRVAPARSLRPGLIP